MIKDILKKTKEKKDLIGIRINEDNWDEVLIGFIEQINASTIILNEIDENGISTGYTTIPMDCILRIDLDDRYQKRLKFIYDNRKNLDSKNQVTILNNSKELIKNIDGLINRKSICTLYFDEDQYVTGIILKKDSHYLLVNNVGDQGDDEGISYYRINNLVGLKYNGIDEQKIALLQKNWKSFY